MFKRVEKQILDFARETGLTERAEIVHGTLYVKLWENVECDHFHKMIRTFYKKQIENDGGVNMYAVGDEFAFDFVPEDREAPVFVEPYSDETYSGKEEMDPADIDEEYGVWSEFAEEGLREDAEIDVALNLEAESKRGK